MSLLPPLYIGSVVKVIGDHCDFLGKEGQVVGLESAEKEGGKEIARVWFGREIDYLNDRRIQDDLGPHAIEPPPSNKQADDPRTWSYSRDDLTICSTWSMKTLATRYFGNHWNCWQEPLTLFVSGTNPCQVAKCPQLSVRRIIVNIWGTVCTADVCTACAVKYHGRMFEIFPWRQ